ncbi:FKBP-type peptidyl-prolyl cis-trans isomerase [Geobacter sp. DSM 9736]|uniref:FKBP-type peptidyl-prolyl cis-trans isomerase n=1 Tax=Geobacter sp. DSM 9736 TaxID=1277350 RepID=UPI000B50487D|nr:FKBP-type peptidyl-prolyl cis-trans isomerase [Geobacter sp. DSM 9736]SNB46571.1 FKBP-type peptidyl-prolyl cis-trans isomerase 2 [Geobacter sp. DSM 9736]
MQADEGKRVTLTFICRLEDGTIYDFTERDLLEFVLGEGNTLPSLEMGVIGMKQGEQRTIRVPVSELDEFPFEPEEAPVEPGFPAGAAGAGYEFVPGEEGDVLNEPPPRTTGARSLPPAGGYVYFEVELVKVRDAETEL